MSRLFSYVKGWRGIFLITYMWLILMAYVIVYINLGLNSPVTVQRLYIISVMEIILLALIYICPHLLNWAENFALRTQPQTMTKKDNIYFSFKAWFAIFTTFFLMYFIFYPGAFNPDNIMQYYQALGLAQYSDHHPVLHTLLVFTLPLKITGGWIGSINLFQIIFFSFTLACMAYILIQYSNYLYTKLFLIYIILNPLTLNMAIMPLKDTSFAIASLLLMIFATITYFTNGEWLNIKNSIAFIIVMTACTLFRHNAILFTLPLFFAVSLYIRKRQAILMFMCFLSLIYLIRYPLYESLNVERPVNNRQIETLGLPMTIIGNAVKEVPEKLDDEVLDFAYSMAPQKVWEDHFRIYNGFNSIKNAESINMQVVENAGWKKVLRLAFKCFKEAPLESLRGMFIVTEMVYGIAGVPLGMDTPRISENNSIIEKQRLTKLDFLSKLVKKLPFKSIENFIDGDNFTLQALIVFFQYSITILFKHIFRHIGMINLIILIFILAKLNLKKSNDWKRMCFALPVFTYNFGTMLLLTGPDYRYFYYSYLVLPLVLLILLRDNSEVK